jgi:hypothetical protein
MTSPEISPDLRYPVGEFDRSTIDRTRRSEHIQTIADLPKNLRIAVDGLSHSQLDTPYRAGGWTVRQTVHHLADSHMNAYCRMKLALTEEFPTIRPYFEDRWAELPDSMMPIDISLKIIDGVHSRAVVLLNSMTNLQFERKLNHPETGEWTLHGLLALYAWHSRHHTAHITRLRERENW